MVAFSSRSSSRVLKRTLPFHWTSDGMSYKIPKAPVRVLSFKKKKKIDRFFPALALEKSTIRGGGKGIHAREPIQAGDFISEYRGEKIGEYEAKRLQDQVWGNFLYSISLFYIQMCAVMFEQGKATHIKRIGGSDWYLNSRTSARFPMQWFVDNNGVAGFANTKYKKKDCNAEFVTIGESVFLVARVFIDVGEEVFAYYNRSSEIALQKKRKIDALTRLAEKKVMPLQRKLEVLTRLAAKLPLRTQRKLIALAHLAAKKVATSHC